MKTDTSVDKFLSGFNCVRSVIQILEDILE
jgi:hypothetical protein